MCKPQQKMKLKIDLYGMKITCIRNILSALFVLSVCIVKEVHGGGGFSYNLKINQVMLQYQWFSLEIL